MNLKKLAVGFGIFLVYFIAARIIENKVAIVAKLASGNFKSA